MTREFEQWAKQKARELKRVGVELLDASRVMLKCLNCGQRWSPDAPLTRGWRLCPNGCNQRG